MWDFPAFSCRIFRHQTPGALLGLFVPGICNLPNTRDRDVHKTYTQSGYKRICAKYEQVGFS